MEEPRQEVQADREAERKVEVTFTFQTYGKHQQVMEMVERLKTSWLDLIFAGGTVKIEKVKDRVIKPKTKGKKK